MRVVFDVDVEIESAEPTAPLIDQDRIVIAGGEVALLASCDRSSGTVMNMMFSDEPEVDVSGPMRVNGTGDHVEWAFASIDRPRLKLHVTVVDRELRVLRTRDISADDPETPELLIDGRIAWFRADPHGYVLSVDDDNSAAVVRRLDRELAPRWTQSKEHAVFSDDQFVVAVERRSHHVFVRALATGETWTQFFQPRTMELAGFAPGKMMIVHHEHVDDEYMPGPELELLDLRTNAEHRHRYLEARHARVLAMHLGGDQLTSLRTVAGFALMHAKRNADPTGFGREPRIVGEHVALVGPDLAWCAGDEPLLLPLNLTDRARATVDGDLVVIRDGRRLIAVNVRAL